MSDDEDDYLSDKFLIEATSTSESKSYAERRKEAQRLAERKNAENRKKSRRQLEEEAREEGLSKSLIQRAQEEEAEGYGQRNKALAMMMKMGFKPGQSLGRTEDDTGVQTPDAPSTSATPEAASRETSEPPTKSSHRVVPLPLNEWRGKQGIGLGKRAASPGASERLAKMAKMADDRQHQDFRDRARQEYEERRAESRLAPAQRTCTTLDEKAGREFNVLWLNPTNPDTFPEGFIDALDDPVLLQLQQQHHAKDAIEGRIRARMQADALQPIASLEDEDAEEETTRADADDTPYSEEDLKEAAQFLRLAAQDRLHLVLDYMRQKYAYCFWCGTQYDDQEDMAKSCPGSDEESHD